MRASPTKILIVEDQPREREALSRMLRSEGFQVVTAGSVVEAVALADQAIDLVISDLRLGSENGLDLIKHLRPHHANLPFVMVTAYGDVSSAVSAMKLGAIDFLTKPLIPADLLALIRRQITAATSSCADASPGLGNIVGQSPAMRQVFDRIKRVAASKSIVLISGETGTGKELVAVAIHQHSSRAGGPYKAINIAALPETLIEAELFGVARGAFTGATQDRQGLFAAAHGGTLFIDEIGEFPLHLQPKLLRVLEGFNVTPIGSRDEQCFDVRVVVATNRDLGQMVQANQFREDLWHRINVLTVELPPLRQRREDIPLLLARFLADASTRHHVAYPTLSPNLNRFLANFDWPGNVRQLRNAVEHLVVMSQHTELDTIDLPQFLLQQCSGLLLDSSPPELRAVAQTTILEALKKFGGNRTLAAIALGISLRTLQRKLKSWGTIPADEFESESQ